MSAAVASQFLFGAPPTGQLVPSLVTLRPYQTSAIAWVAAERGPGARLLLVSPTGSGKTLTAAQVILDEVARGGRVIFAAHRQELIAQTYGSLLRLGLPEPMCGVVMGDGVITHPLTRRRANCARPLAPVQVASIDTLRNRPPPRGITLLFFDESHRALSPSYLKLAQSYPEATVVGLTATPWRGDGRGLGALFSKLYVVATPKRLMDDGHLVEPRVFSHPHRADVSKVSTVAGDYNEKELAAACDKRELVGSIVEHWQRHLAGRRTVAFAVNVEHSKHIVETFVAAGIPAEHLDGNTPDDERAGILGRLASGETLVVSNCAVLCEGFDCPAVEGCILARPTKSLSLYLQCAGRALRPAPGKLGAIVLDHAGCALEHGLPQDDREYSLEGKKKRAKSAVSVKECPKCFAALPSSAKVCSFCGHSFVETSSDAGEPLRERDGQLVEMRANSLRALMASTETARFELQSWAQQVDRKYNLDPGTTNGRAKRVFRKSRTEMTADELAAVRRWFLVEEPWLEAPAVEEPVALLRFAPVAVEEASPW